MLALPACLLVMLLGFLGLACVDRRALPPALGTAAVLLCAGGYVAYLFTQ